MPLPPGASYLTGLQRYNATAFDAVTGGTSTDKFQDSTNGDTTSWESVTGSASSPGGAVWSIAANGDIIGMVDCGVGASLQGAEITYRVDVTDTGLTGDFWTRTQSATVSIYASNTSTMPGSPLATQTPTFTGSDTTFASAGTLTFSLGSATAFRYFWVKVAGIGGLEYDGNPIGAGKVLSVASRISDIRPFGTAGVANEIPQCSTRTYAVDASPIAQISSALWEIVSPDGVLLDLGDRYDRFGPGRWGVLSPGLGGAGTMTVTAPNTAPIATGYTARIAAATLTFDVIAGSGCPGSPSGASPAMILFSTGLLYVAPRLKNGTLTRTNVGSPPAATNALANAFDASLATVVDLTYTNGSNRQYAALDLGASSKVGSVLLRNVTCGGTVAVYVSATSITNGNFAGATALTSADTQPATDAPLLFLPTSPATTVTGRYVYIVCTTAAVAFGDLDIRGERIIVGAVQSGNLNVSYQTARVYDACPVNLYAVGDAQYDIEALLTAESAIWSPRAANILYGTTYDVGVSVTTLTGGITDRPLRFNAEFTVLDPTINKNVRFTLYEMVAPGMQWQFNRTAFATNNFTANLRFSDTSGVPMRIEIDN